MDDKNENGILQEIESSESGFFTKQMVFYGWLNSIYDNKNYIKGKLDNIMTSLEVDRDEEEIQMLQSRLRSYEMLLSEIDNMIYAYAYDY